VTQERKQFVLAGLDSVVCRGKQQSTLHVGREEGKASIAREVWHGEDGGVVLLRRVPLPA
jgi:hypothetical protein